MFTRYWRSYPWYLQLLLFALMMLVLMSFGSLLVLGLIPRLTGIPATEYLVLTPTSPVKAIRSGLFAQMLNHFISFTGLGLLFAYFTTPHRQEYLGLKKPGNSIHWLAVAGLMIGLLPLMLAGQEWMQQHVHMGADATAMQKRNENTVNAFLSLKGPGDYLLLSLSFILLPAFGEELVFRGVLMRLLHKRIANTPIAITLTAVAFALMHPVPYGMPFIFLSGFILGLIYWYTRSLWCSILAHVIFNGIQIALSIMPETKAFSDGKELPARMLLAGVAVFLLSLLLLYRKRTPLPNDWSADYLHGERWEPELPDTKS